jgi:NAD-dependent dihydropyrimidine dehydrogenase PreA subunit
MSGDVYRDLQEFLDTLPGGFPATSTGLDQEILRKLFTADDAGLAVHLSRDLESAEAIALRCGGDTVEVADLLQSMAERGLIFRVREGDRVLYCAEQFVVGIYENRFAMLDKEFAELMEDYMISLGMSMLAQDTFQFRIIPVGTAVETVSAVATYDQIREIVRQQEAISVAPCICRKQTALVGDTCDRPFDGCMVFGDLAEFWVDLGFARRVSVEEALKVLARSEEAGLVLQHNNSQEIKFVCSCCTCCCGPLKTMKRLLGNVADFVVSSYRGVSDSENCVGCGICVERCPMEAIVEEGDTVRVDPARCIGCGVCVPSCPEQAMSLELKEGALVPPVDDRAMGDQMLGERGLL